MTPVTASSHHPPPGKPRLGIAALLTGGLPGRVRRPRSCQKHPANGRRGDKIPTPIVGPSPITTASAAPTQDAAPANSHR
jgi:hypothetical protein